MSEDEELEQALPKTTRQLASLYQITGALEHFHKLELECCITLASAAEGIMPDAKNGVLFNNLRRHVAQGARS
jgi:hypothetical protein